MARILILEDDAVTAMTEVYVLSQAAHIVTLRDSNFEQTIDEVDWSQVDVLVADRLLGDYDGMEIVRWVAEHHPNVKRIVLTASNGIHDSDLASRVLHKPCPPSLLLEIIGE